MIAALSILIGQGLLGALDNLIHHELQARLPSRVSARWELSLHAAREAIYGLLFLALAWGEWHGIWAWLLAALLLVEIVITIADFLEEDGTRRLPQFERVLHTVLAISYGAFLAAFMPELARWAGTPTGVVATSYGLLSWLLTLYAIGVLAWSTRNTIAALTLYRTAAQQEELHPPAPATGDAVLVTGGTGFIGTALIETLIEDGRRVILLTRDAMQAREQFGPRVAAIEDLDLLPSETRIDAIVNLAGASITGGLWTQRRKAVLIDSRLRTTGAVNALIERLIIEGRLGAAGEMTIGQLQAVYLRHCEDYYRKADGSPTGETKNIRGALRYLSPVVDDPARDFGPRKLTEVQERMIADGVVS